MKTFGYSNAFLFKWLYIKLLYIPTAFRYKLLHIKINSQIDAFPIQLL